MRHSLAAAVLAACLATPSAATVTTSGMTVTIDLRAIGTDGGNLRDALGDGYTGSVLCDALIQSFGLCSVPEIGTIVSITVDEWRDIQVKRLISRYVDAWRIQQSISTEESTIEADPTVIGDPP